MCVSTNGVVVARTPRLQLGRQPHIREPIADGVRWLWLILASVALYSAWLSIALTATPAPSWLDASVWVAALLIIALRRLDSSRDDPRGGHTQVAVSERRLDALYVLGIALCGEIIGHHFGVLLSR